MLDERTIQTIAARAAAELMTNGRGEQATRLVLFHEVADARRDLGGWCRQAVEAQIANAIRSELSTPSAPSRPSRPSRLTRN